MQRLSGFLLIVTGTGLAGYSYLPPHPDGAARLAEVTRISIVADAPARRSDDGIRTFSPTSPAFRLHDPIAPAKAPTAPEAVVPETARPIAPWTTVVSAEDEPSRVLRTSTPSDNETRVELARDIQRELRRVGCYAGELTGVWSPDSKRAMSAFMDRVNATLPVEQPDYILLTLVQGQRDNACGAACPSGQMMADGNRCLPRAVVAQASRKAQRLAERAAALSHIAAAETTPPAAKVKGSWHKRPSQTPPVAIADATPPASTATPPTLSRTDAEPLPWLYADNVSAMGTSAMDTAPVPRPDPLPGRMGIGGPDDRSAPGQAPITTARLESDGPASQADQPRSSTTAAAAAPSAEPEPQAAVTDPDADAYDVPSRKQKKHGNAVRRPEPPVGMRAYAAPPPYYRYASNGGARRRGQPPAGTQRYNLMQSLGGIY